MPDSPCEGLCRRLTGNGSMSRRELMAGLGGACCTTEEAASGSFHIEGNLLTVDLRHIPPDGAVKIIRPDIGLNLIIIRSRRGHYAALDRSCTHGGAQVTWNKRNRTVQCTSWGHSEFALDGKVLGGSARRPLRSYPVVVDRGKLVVRLDPAHA